MIALIGRVVRRMMKRNDNEETIHMQLSPEDSHQVQAILRTHAEMQDMSATRSMELLARMRRDEPDSELIDDLEGQIEILEADSENLKRIALLF